MSWQHRVLAHLEGDHPFFQIHEVQLGEDNEPVSYHENPIRIGAESLGGLGWIIEQLKEVKKKPILWAGERFPEPFKVRYRCHYCTRSLGAKGPHRCKGGFRKRKQIYTPEYENHTKN